MDKDGTAPPGDPGSRVVVNLDNHVVKAVVAPEPIAWVIGRPPEGMVVAPIRRVFAPRILRPDAAGRQECARPTQPIGPPPQPHGSKPAARRAAVALAFIGLDAGPTQRDRQGHGAGEQPTLGSQARPNADADLLE